MTLSRLVWVLLAVVVALMILIYFASQTLTSGG
jgi:hypothetical protein